jgi:hypothetical protein
VDCPAGTPVCDLDAQACVVCLADGDCGRGETCMADACQFMGACAGPEDCPATRTCGNDGLCRPAPGCPGDRLDGLDPPATLAARTYTGLLLCDGTQDRYIVQPNPGEALRVTLRHDPALGDLALDLSALPPLLERFGSSDTRFGVEIVILPAADPIRPALVTVSGRPGAHVPYSLTVERTAADACAPDALEGPLGNDSLETAARLPPGPQTLSLCEGDEDWLAFRASAGTHLDARVSPADVLLSLVDAGGRVLADGMPGGAQTTLAGDFQIPTDAFLRLRSPDAEARRRVDLQVDATAAPGAERLACDHVLALQPGALLAPPDTLRVQRFTVSCAFPFPGFTGDFVARFSLAAAARVTLAPSDGAAVALRSDCDDPGTELLCGLSGAPALTDIALAAGTYYVVVQAFSPTPPQVRMTVR